MVNSLRDQVLTALTGGLSPVLPSPAVDSCPKNYAILHPEYY